MVKIYKGLDFQLPKELHDPYNWGGEATVGETNPIRNYIDACRDAADAAPFLGGDGVDYGVPTREDWEAQAEAAAGWAKAFDDLDRAGRPHVIPEHVYELYEELARERPDVSPYRVVPTAPEVQEAGGTPQAPRFEFWAGYDPHTKAAEVIAACDESGWQHTSHEQIVADVLALEGQYQGGYTQWQNQQAAMNPPAASPTAHGPGLA